MSMDGTSSLQMMSASCSGSMIVWASNAQLHLDQCGDPPGIREVQCEQSQSWHQSFVAGVLLVWNQCRCHQWGPKQRQNLHQKRHLHLRSNLWWMVWRIAILLGWPGTQERCPKLLSVLHCFDLKLYLQHVSKCGPWQQRDIPMLNTWILWVLLQNTSSEE